MHVWPVPGGSAARDRPLPIILRAAPEAEALAATARTLGVPGPLWTVALVTPNPEPATDTGRGFLHCETLFTNYKYIARRTFQK